MARITRDEVDRVAALARLTLSESQASRMAADLESILDYVETLEELDTRDVPPTSHAIPLATPLRDDEPVAPMDPELAVASAPAREGTAFLVPQVIETEQEG